MGSRTREVGGGAATPVAQGWNQFLGSQLFGQAPSGVNPTQWQELQANTRGPVGMGGPPVLREGGSGAPGSPITPFMNMAASNAQQPFQQQQTFQGALQSALGGNVRDVSGANQALQQYFQNPNQRQFTPQSFANPYTSQTLTQAQTTALPTNFGQGQTGMADLSRFGTAAQSNVDLNRGFGSQPQAITAQNIAAAQSNFDSMRGFGTQPAAVTAARSATDFNNLPNILAAQSNLNLGMGMGTPAQQVGPSQSMFNTQASLGAAPSGGAFDQMLMDMIGRGGAQQAESGFQAAQAGPGIQLAQPDQVDLNNPLIAAQAEGLRRAEALSAADLRARFGAEGAGSLGTGAQFAEAQLRAESAPRQAALLQQAIQQQQQQSLAERQAAAQVGLGSRGQDVQTAIANMQGGLQGAQNINQFNTANLGNLLQAATTGRGQELQTGLGVRGQNLEQLGLGAQQAALNAQLGQQASLANAQNALQARGIDVNQLGLQAQQAALNAQLQQQAGTQNAANAMQALGLRSQENQFNAQLQQQAALQNVANQLQARGLDINQLSLGQQQALANAQMQQQANMQNAANQLQANQQNAANFLQSRGLDINQLGLQAQQGQFNAGQQNALQQAMLSAQLQNQQLGNQFGLGAAGLNLQAGQSNNANALAAAQMANQFNLANAQNMGQFGLGTNQLNSQNALQAQQMNNQMFQNMIGQGLNLNQMGNANTLAALAQLFGGFQQAGGLGTAQRQIVQQPSMFGQLANAGLTLGAAYLGGRRG